MKTISNEMLSLMCAVSAGSGGMRYRHLLKKGRKRGLFKLNTKYILTEKGERFIRERFPHVYAQT
jgi:hypothetical protein